MAIYKKYGETFKKLRLQKNLKLSSFSYLGISPAALCKFENGKSMLKFDKLCLALSELSVTLSEYEKCLNRYDLAHHEQYIQVVGIARMENNIPKLQSCYKDAQDIEEKMFALGIKSLYASLTVEEVDELSSYFEGIILWRYIDLYTLDLTLNQLRPRQLIYLLEGFFLDSEQSYALNSLEHRTRFTHVLCRAILILSFHHHKEVTEHFLKCIHPQKFLHTMFTTNLYNFTKGYWKMIFEDNEQGKKEMEGALHNFEMLSYPVVANYYKQIYKQSLKNCSTAQMKIL